jgi:5-methyltetrahydropteroyltriglutamate--homocysteine methyltransferase
VKRSTHRQLLTTHIGSLHRPAALREAAEDRREEAITEAVREVVARQVEAGIDVVSDGDMSKPSYSTYIAERATGFGGSRKEPRRWLEAEDFPDWGGPKIEINLDPLPPAVPAVVGDIRRIDTGAAERDAANLAAAVTEAGAAEGFLTAASPGVLTIFMENQHYPSHDAYIEALIPVMREEYEAAYRAGLLVQIDSPDLSAFDVQFPGMTLDEWKRVAAAHVDAINAATAGIPPEAMRLHVCWGNHEAPHTRDIALREILPNLLRARPAALCIQAANPRHEHEWRVFEDIKLPEDKILIPGVIDTTTSFVEHPELVAERIMRFARVVGPERLIAGTDCGFATFADHYNLTPSISYAKLRALVAGAALASGQL